MSDILMYTSVFFMVFFSSAIMCFCLRFSFWLYMEYWPKREQQRLQHIRQTNAEGINTRDRQANHIADDTSRDNRYNDIFFIEPNSVEAARIRAQLEKDDKDLPSYDEVMRMTNVTTPTAAPATNNAFVPAITASSHSIAASSTSINTTDTTITVPTYRASSSIPRPLTPPPYTAQPPESTTVVLPITTALHITQTQAQTS